MTPTRTAVGIDAERKLLFHLNLARYVASERLDQRAVIHTDKMSTAAIT
jgi:hypothetical protein